MKKTKTCNGCESRESCKTPCKEVNKILWKDNRVMERNFGDFIMCYPQKKEVHFSEVTDHKLDEFSDDTVFPWSSGDYKLRQTNVFIDKFFNRASTSELAEKYNVRASVISTMYENCLQKIEQILGLLDLRASGIKNLKPERFSEDQKMFMLVHIFRFNSAEVAEMFHHSKNHTSGKLNRMADKYKAIFDGNENAQNVA